MEYFLVVDLEATCSDDGSVPREEMETIEIGAVMVSSATQQPVGEFQTFVRPVRHPELTDFCHTLTSIDQSDVDAAPLFPAAFADFLTWADRYPGYTFCSWGEFDRTQLQRDCLWHSRPYPLGRAHINLKAEFASAFGRRKKMGVSAALKHVGFTFSGSHHRGIDDARNIARLIPFVFPPRDGAEDRA